MKATLEFDCNLEGDSFKEALQGGLWREAMQQVVAYLDNTIDSDGYSSDTLDTVQQIRDRVFNILVEDDLLLWD